ncbi:MAG: response regulator, partial [Deltaproteobacteria bacterium]|nr:response regulator [Deltaproteobacteria bacterium]
STFAVCLPLGQSTTEIATAEDPCAAPDPPRGLRILIVDDNVDAAELLSMLLETDGSEIRIAHTGLAALDLAAELRPHVVLLDLGLPGIDGYEVARRLRADSSLTQPLLVAVTGWGTEEDRRKTKDAGFDQHLVKPVDHARLAQLIASAAVVPSSR